MVLLDDVMAASGLAPANEPNATLAMSMPEALLLLQQIVKNPCFALIGDRGLLHS